MQENQQSMNKSIRSGTRVHVQVYLRIRETYVSEIMVNKVMNSDKYVLNEHHAMKVYWGVEV